MTPELEHVIGKMPLTQLIDAVRNEAVYPKDARRHAARVLNEKYAAHPAVLGKFRHDPEFARIVNQFLTCTENG